MQTLSSNDGTSEELVSTSFFRFFLWQKKTEHFLEIHKKVREIHKKIRILEQNALKTNNYKDKVRKQSKQIFGFPLNFCWFLHFQVICVHKKMQSMCTKNALQQ